MQQQTSLDTATPADIRPWYREPWPWVLIAIPFLTVVASGYTLWLAISNPDYLVVEEQSYDVIKAELRVQSATEAKPELQAAETGNGER